MAHTYRKTQVTQFNWALTESSDQAKLFLHCADTYGRSRFSCVIDLVMKSLFHSLCIALKLHGCALHTDWIALDTRALTGIGDSADTASNMRKARLNSAETVDPITCLELMYSENSHYSESCIQKQKSGHNSNNGMNSSHSNSGIISHSSSSASTSYSNSSTVADESDAFIAVGTESGKVLIWRVSNVLNALETMDPKLALRVPPVTTADAPAYKRGYLPLATHIKGE